MFRLSRTHLIRTCLALLTALTLFAGGQTTARAAETPPFRVYLTFEDGPTQAYTPQILDLLAQYNARATFFVNGYQIAGNEAILQRIVRDGHALGNHLWTEPGYYSGAPADRVQAAYAQTEAAIRAALGPDLLPIYDAQTKLFRQPGGGALAFPETPGVSVISYNWHVDSDDCGWWMDHPTGAEFDQKVLDNVLNIPQSKGRRFNVYDFGDGVVVAMHDINRVTGRILPFVLSELQAAGASFEALPRPWDSAGTNPVVLGTAPRAGVGTTGVVLAGVTRGSSRVRTAPRGTAALLVEPVAAGTPLIVTGYVPGWYRVQLNGGTGWVTTARVKVFGPIPSLPLVSP